MIQSKELFNYTSRDEIIALRIKDDIHNYAIDDEDEEGDD